MVGTLEELFRDDDTQQPEWAVVRTGMEKGSETDEAQVSEEVRKEQIEADGEIER